MPKVDKKGHLLEAPPTFEAIKKALDELIWAGGHTVVLVAHRLSTVVNAHQIVVMDHGQVSVGLRLGLGLVRGA